MPTTTQDHYQTLGVSRTATQKEIKTAFRQLARKHHPDTNKNDPQAEERFKQVNEAYEVLSDEADRRIYDRYGDDWRAYRDAGFDGTEPQPSTRRPNSPGAGTRGTSYTPTSFDSDDSFGSMFGSLFGQASGAAGGFQQRSRKGQDIEQRVEVTFDEAFRGTERRFEVQTPETCSLCHGEGMVRGGICPRCSGAGTIMRPHKIDVTIPAGVTSGQRIRVRGKGGPGIGGGPNGDVFLIVQVRPDTRFEIDGHNLRTTIDVPVLDAILGGEVTVPTPTGKVALTIPEATANGKVFRLRNQGMPMVKGSDRGDLLARINIVMPGKISEEERNMYRKLRGDEPV